jgi:molybdate transport system substrate-binding protein
VRRAAIGSSRGARVVTARVVTTLLALALVAAGCGDDGGGSRPPVVVSAAASLQAVFTQYGKAFAEGRARFSFAGSDVLATQIRNGVRPDVYAAANTRLPDGLYNDGFVYKPIRFAANELVLATPKDSDKVRSIDDLAKPGVRLVIGAQSVPVGTYTHTVIDQLPGDEVRAILGNVRSEEPDVTGIIGKLTQGAADAGFVYITDVRAAKGGLDVIRLPSRVQPIVRYGVALVKGAKHPEEAKAFIYGLLAGAGREALDDGGFGSTPPT